LDHEGETFDEGLRDEQTVEWIAMMVRQRCSAERVRRGDGR
jgi:hypothetical protein